MGRPSKGWRLRKRPGRPYSARWTIDEAEEEVGLGTNDRREAEAAARAAYALAVQGVRKRKRKRPLQGGAPTEELGRQWLAASVGTLKPRTRELYAVHIHTLAAAFANLTDVTTDSAEEYQRVRLSVVKSATVRKELATLRGLLRWAHAQGKLGDVPEVRSIPRARGTPFAKRRRVAADELSPSEIAKFLSALPRWSRERKGEPRFPVRARFVLQYETGLRPSFVDVLSVPEHYRKGSTHLVIPAADDKNADERRIPLTPKAKQALDSVAPEQGTIFGEHDYRDRVSKAARAALSADKAARFTGAHLRSARITHLLERTGNVPGVQRLVGQSQLATTSRYNRASDRAAEAVVRAVSGRGFRDK